MVAYLDVKVKITGERTKEQLPYSALMHYDLRDIAHSDTFTQRWFSMSIAHYGLRLSYALS